MVKGRVKVDEYGDMVQATNVPGDHWRGRHDQVKMTIFNMCRWAGLPTEVEVFNMFSRHIPQEGLARVDQQRQRQAMVPDFKISIQSAGQSRHDLSCMR